jgi:hypothetical protein
LAVEIDFDCRGSIREISESEQACLVAAVDSMSKLFVRAQFFEDSDNSFLRTREVCFKIDVSPKLTPILDASNGIRYIHTFESVSNGRLQKDSIKLHLNAVLRDLNSISAIAIPRSQLGNRSIEPSKSIEFDKSIGKSSANSWESTGY